MISHFTNIWQTHWEIYSNTGELAKVKGQTYKGSMVAKTDDVAIILTAIFVPNYLWIAYSLLVLVVIIVINA